MINEYRIKYGRGKSISGKKIPATSDPLDQIKKLKDLLDAGAITESEYEEKKQELLRKVA